MTETGFSAFDQLTGGLPAGRDYLLYGGIGTGKSSFALNFLHQGLATGEPAVLVTRRSPRAVMEQARTLGWDLELYVRNGRLVVLEYPEDLHEHTSIMREAGAIQQGLRDTHAGSSMRRIVFDPVTPLLALPGATYHSQRVKNLMQAVGELEATTFYVVDTPEGESYLAGCKDQVFGMIRFDTWGGLRRLSIERLPGIPPRQNQIIFDIRPDRGLVRQDHDVPGIDAFADQLDAPMAPDVAPSLPKNPWSPRPQAGGTRTSGRHTLSAGWLALLASSSTRERASWRAALEPQADVLEARGPAECLGMAASEGPELIIISQDSRGITALELIRKMRSVDETAPVILIGDKLRRVNDRVKALEAGADLTLDAPVDLRLLRLHARMLLGRSSASAGAFRRATDGFALTAPPPRPRLVCTRSLDQFTGRMRAEAEYALAASLPLAVVSFQSTNYETADELASLCTFLSRQDDLTYSGEHGAAVLLAEATDAESFLTRFEARWCSAARPIIDIRYFDGTETFAATTAEFLLQALGDRNESPNGSLAVSAAAGAVDGVNIVAAQDDAPEPVANGAMH